MSGQLSLGRGLTLPLEVVTEATAIVATRGAGKSSASAVVVEEAVALDVQVVVFDRTGVYWGLRSNAKGNGSGLAVYVLGGPHGDVPLEASAGALMADVVVDSGLSFVLDLSDFSKASAVRFSADFLERLYQRKARARATTLLVIDEAHFYAPQTPRGGFKGDSARLMGAMEDVVGLGRSRGLGVVLTTQRTQALNKAILDLIETLLVMRMLSPRARDAVQDWIREKHEDDRVGVIGTLESLPTGTAWVWSPLRGILQQVAIRRIRTFDSYFTPRPGQARVEPTARKELDLAVLGEQIQATAERVKAEDPRELRKRLSELERQLRETQAERVPAEPERVEVEVPFLPPAVVEAALCLDSIEGEARAMVESIESLARRARAVIKAVQDFKPEARPRSAPARSRTVRPHPVAGGEQDNATNGAGRSSLPSPARSDDGARMQLASSAGEKVLRALGWLAAVGIDPATRLQVAMISGFHPRTNSFLRSLSELNEAGRIEYPRPGFVALVSAEDREEFAPQAAPSEYALREMIFRQVGRRATFLREILAASPISRDELAERLGYHPRTNTFLKSLATLKSLGLIEYPQPGMVAPTDVLFLRAAA